MRFLRLRQKSHTKQAFEVRVGLFFIQDLLLDLIQPTLGAVDFSSVLVRTANDLAQPVEQEN